MYWLWRHPPPLELDFLRRIEAGIESCGSREI